MPQKRNVFSSDMRKWIEERGQRHMEILILHRCVQGHKGALCFIITPGLWWNGRSCCTRGLQSAPGQDNWFQSEICFSECPWKWVLFVEIMSSLQISVRGRYPSSQPGGVQTSLLLQNTASQTMDTGWRVFPCGSLPVEAANHTHLHRLAGP